MPWGVRDFVIAPCHVPCRASPVPPPREKRVLEQAPVFPFCAGLRDALLHGTCVVTAVTAAFAGEFHFCRDLQSQESQTHITGGEQYPLELPFPLHWL